MNTNNNINNAELNYYEILQLPLFSNLEAIKAQYKILIKNAHPDKNNGNHNNDFDKIKDAYEFLNENKIIYDKKLKNKVDIVDKAFEIEDYEIDGDDNIFKFSCVQCFHLNEIGLKEQKINFSSLLKVR